MPRKPNSSGLVLDGSSPRSRKKPWWSLGNQSRRWWRYGISVSSSTVSWQWRLTWTIVYVATCINSANFVKRSLTLDSSHTYPPWCPPLAPCTAPTQLQNRHTSSWLYSRHRPGLFRWRLMCSGDWSPWTNQPAFSDAWRSCNPSNTNKIGRTEFPYIRTDGVELAPWFAQASCYKPRTFSKRTENVPV